MPDTPVVPPPPALDATLSEWREYGRLRGLSDVDHANRSQIRTLLGIGHTGAPVDKTAGEPAAEPEVDKAPAKRASSRTRKATEPAPAAEPTPEPTPEPVETLAPRKRSRRTPEPEPVLTVEQAARVRALREARELVVQLGLDITPSGLIDLADFVTTGTRPPVTRAHLESTVEDLITVGDPDDEHDADDDGGPSLTFAGVPSGSTPSTTNTEGAQQ